MTDLSPEHLKIGAFAELLGTNLRTLRYYEELGLLEPARRSEGGFRYYRRTDVHRVELIRELQSLGLQLEEIGELVDTRPALPDHDAWIDKVKQALTTQSGRVEARVQALREQQGKIDAALRKLADCQSCRFCPEAKNNYCEPCQNTGLSLPELLSALF
ncbi:MAG: DNA-binding transcriptional MerR regulator [Chlamydiales bacterium]|jgi:DNA-binding transcriptional MerR regulator